MTCAEAIAYIENYTWSKSRLGLSRTRELLHALGDPQNDLKFVHVAGSNGKGSTCAMVERILRAAGYRTGLYISPYIQDFRERIQLSGASIPAERLAAITERVAAAADGMEDHPSQFELVTAIGMLYFAEEGADIVVLEVGMGGSLDSTNVIGPPEAAVITNIGLEHTEYLGSTLSEIASAKAGIIKPGCACVCYDLGPEAAGVVRRVCEEKSVPLRPADFTQIKPLAGSLGGQRFSYRGREYDLALLGAHQLRNAAVALETVEALRGRGWAIDEKAVTEGLRAVRWPARLEVLGREPLFLLDGGHNPQCAEALAESLRSLLPGDGKAVFLMGVLADKDYPRIIDAIAPYASEFLCLTPLSDRALSGEDLAAYLTGRGLTARACGDAAEGIAAALDAAGRDGAVVAFGSLYLAGAVRSAFAPQYRAWLRERMKRTRARMTPLRCGFLSDRVVRHIRELSAYESARTVMLYRAMRGEVRLQALEADAGDKRFVYPRCAEGGTLEVLRPLERGAWLAGPYGIEEPDPARAERVDPREIDLVLCPCTAFDEQGNRLGMGGGYYDRFLPGCENAFIAAVAFGYQRTAAIPPEPWDRPVDAAVTEDGITLFT